MSATSLALALLSLAAAPAVEPPIPAPPPAGPHSTVLPPPPPTSTSSGRIVLYQKPSGSDAAAPAPLPQKKADPTPPAVAQPDTKTPGGSGAPGVTDPTALLDRDRVFRLLSDEELSRRIARELYQEELARRRKDSDQKISEEGFVPPVTAPAGAGIPYQTKVIRNAYPPIQTPVVSGHVVHRRLYFEEKNAERYGWDTGIIQPVLSTAYFYKDVLLWPSKLASQPFERYDTSAGKCLPGDPVPYFLYPPEIGLFGGSVGAAAIIGTVFLFP